MSKFLKGHTFSQKIKDKISKTRIERGCARGKNNPMFGKHHTKKTVEKIKKSRRDKYGGKFKKCINCGKNFWVKKSLLNKKKLCSTLCKSIKRKNGKFKICKICGKKFYISKKRSLSIFCCSNSCRHKASITGNYKKCEYCGKKFWTIKSNKRRRFCSIKCAYKIIRGKKHHCWRGGRLKFRDKIENLLEYKHWRLSIYERDKFICQMPNCDKSCHDIDAHHIIQLIDIVVRNNIKTTEDAVACKELWDIKNGITLCKGCHHKIRHHESAYVKLFQEIIALK